MSELGEAPASSTPILDRLEARQKAFEPKLNPIRPRNMLNSIQNVMGLDPQEVVSMFGTNNPDQIQELIKRDGPKYSAVREGFLTSSYLLFNVRPEYTPETWKEYLRRPMVNHEGRSIIDMFTSGKYEDILQDFEMPLEEEQAA